MVDWNKMANDRKMTEHPAGFLVIIPEQYPDVIPVECSVCGFLMKDFMDLAEHKRYSCCYNCSIKWAQPNSELWVNGWRPQQNEIIKEIERKNCLPSFIYQVK